LVLLWFNFGFTLVSVWFRFGFGLVLERSVNMIGKRIKQRRNELGITQSELARRMGYKHKSSINKIELGKNDVSQSKIIRFAEALNTTPAYLMGWETSEAARLRLYTNKLNGLIDKIEKLDASDLARIDERVSTMLEGDKYAS
jgi:transcriptional regulator with XRE-family HTH domain